MKTTLAIVLFGIFYASCAAPAEAVCAGTSVAAFGAKGDGATDDTAAIQSATNAAAAAGGGRWHGLRLCRKVIAERRADIRRQVRVAGMILQVRIRKIAREKHQKESDYFRGRQMRRRCAKRLTLCDTKWCYCGVGSFLSLLQFGALPGVGPVL